MLSQYYHISPNTHDRHTIIRQPITISLFWIWLVSEIQSRWHSYWIVDLKTCHSFSILFSIYQNWTMIWPLCCWKIRSRKNICYFNDWFLFRKFSPSYIHNRIRISIIIMKCRWIYRTRFWNNLHLVAQSQLSMEIINSKYKFRKCMCNCLHIFTSIQILCQGTKLQYKQNGCLFC